MIEARFFNAEQCIGVVRLVDGVAVLDDYLRDMLEGVDIVEPDFPEPELVTYADGERYLWALPVNFRSAYLWAEVVETGQDDAREGQAAP